MRFQVQIGTVKHNGVFHEKGAIFNAHKKDVAHLIGEGAVVLFEETELTETDSDVGSDEARARITNRTSILTIIKSLSSNLIRTN
ncbi:hypothetical protein ACFSND_31120 [Brevibacillus brevis]|uniref:hypothetical protein n=1 Tax=Brevibacillus brevis TaxID=1393 RepID=UPI00362E1A2D